MTSLRGDFAIHRTRDIAATFRPRTRLGPVAIRAASVQLNETLYSWGFGPCEEMSVIDCAEA